jgi:hypothetical protein
MIPDVHITDWFVDPDDNPPTDGTYVGDDLPRQLRNLKSISREQYNDRWEPFPLMPTKVDADTISFPNDGDAVGFLLPVGSGWAVRLWAPNGTLSYGYARAVTVGTPTTVDLVMTTGTIPDQVERMDIGMIPESRPYHELGRRGQFTVSGTGTTGVITFATVALPPMPRANYHVILTATGFTGAPGLPAFYPLSVSTAVTGFTVTFNAPGAGASITWDWAILFPFQSVNF